jgi:hypothetical protein
VLLLVEEMERRLKWGSGCAEGKKIDEEGDEAVSWVCW